MTIKRLRQTLKLWMTRGARRRGDYLREKKVFASVGREVRYQPREIPLYPELIKIGNNVNVSSRVMFITHDAIHLVHNALPTTKEKLPEKVECIEIGDNVFLGAGCVVLGGVKIGSNIIVSANTYVNRDLESGGIYGGTPARRIGDFDAFWEKRRHTSYPSVAKNQYITPAEIENAWNDFNAKRSD